MKLTRIVVCTLVFVVLRPPASAVTIAVAGVVVHSRDGSRAGGARVGLYTAGAESGGPMVDDHTSESGVYSLVLPNIVGNAPVKLRLTYFSSESPLVAEPIEITVNPSRGGLITEKPGDLRLLDHDAAVFSGPEATERLEAIAATIEVLSRDPQAVDEVAKLRTAALEIDQRVAPMDGPVRFELEKLMGRTEFAARLAAGEAVPALGPLMERSHLAGELTAGPGPDTLSAEARSTIEGAAQVLEAHPGLNVEVSVATQAEAASIERQLFQLGVEASRIEVKSGGGGVGANVMGNLRVVAAPIQ